MLCLGELMCLFCGFGWLMLGFCHLPGVQMFMMVFQGHWHIALPRLLSRWGAWGQEKMKPILNKKVLFKHWEEKNGFFTFFPNWLFLHISESSWFVVSFSFLCHILGGSVCSAHLGFCTDHTCQVPNAGDICLPLSLCKQRPGISHLKHLRSFWIWLSKFVQKLAFRGCLSSVKTILTSPEMDGCASASSCDEDVAGCGPVCTWQALGTLWTSHLALAR